MKRHLNKELGTCKFDEYLLASTKNDEFFCYLGCKKLWLSKQSMLNHYLEAHDNGEDREDLRKWGLDIDALRFQV